MGGNQGGEYIKMLCKIFQKALVQLQRKSLQIKQHKTDIQNAKDER